LGYGPALEHEIESRFAIGNGLVGSRGSLELPTIASRSRTYVAGFFTPGSEDPSSSALGAIADWFRLAVSVDEQPVSVESARVIDLVRRLDLRRGLLLTEYRLDLAGKEVHFRSLRFVSQANRRIAVQAASFEISEATRVTLVASIRSLSQKETHREADAGCLTWGTISGGRKVAVAGESRLDIGSRRLPGISADLAGSGRSWTWRPSAGRAAVLSKIVGFGVNDGEEDAACREATEVVGQASRTGLPRLLNSHLGAWEKR
jgi:kojibiose phosphorylase